MLLLLKSLGDWKSPVDTINGPITTSLQMHDIEITREICLRTPILLGTKLALRPAAVL